MNLRKITSLTALVSFSLEFLTSVILYIVPQGRVAYWADWRLWGLSKTQWDNLHVNLGVLFLLAICLHVYYNWNPIVAYLKNKAKQLKIFTKEFNVALLLTLLFVFGTFFEIPPFSTIIEFSTSIKDNATKKYGEPPYGHAELSSLKTFASKVNLDLSESIACLKKSGVSFENEKQSLAQIAKQNNMSPQQVYLAMKPQLAVASGPKKLPEDPTPGFGKRSLTDICHEYDLDIKIILRGLAKSSITAKAEMSIKEIAEQNDTSPIDLFEIIKQISRKNK